MTPLKKAKIILGKETFKHFQALKLTPKQILFLATYISNGFNGMQAYLDTRLGSKKMSKDTAKVCASQLLTRPNCREAVRYILDAYLAEHKLKLDKDIINVLTRRAFYDPSRFIEPDGSPKFKSWDEVPEEWRCVIDGIETRAYGKDGIQTHTVIKLADRESAAEKLSKYITLYKDVQVNETQMSPETATMLEKIFVQGKSDKT